jgi:hypothetical protein
MTVSFEAGIVKGKKKAPGPRSSLAKEGEGGEYTEGPFCEMGLYTGRREL